MSQQRRRALTTVSRAPPLDHRLSRYVVVARLSHLLFGDLAVTYARESVAAQPLDASLLIGGPSRSSSQRWRAVVGEAAIDTPKKKCPHGDRQIYCETTASALVLATNA
jgi:hypothetical protein